MKVLRVLFFGVLLGVFWHAFRSADWYTHAYSSKMTWTLGPTKAPIWRPPSPATYLELQRSFPELGQTPISEVRISSDLDFTWLITNLMFAIWGASSAFGFVYFLSSERSKDLVLHIASRVGVCVTIAGVLTVIVLPITFLSLFGPLAITCGVMWGVDSFSPATIAQKGFSLE
jgi:hypothetical protein